MVSCRNVYAEAKERERERTVGGGEQSISQLGMLLEYVIKASQSEPPTTLETLRFLLTLMQLESVAQQRKGNHGNKKRLHCDDYSFFCSKYVWIEQTLCDRTAWTSFLGTRFDKACGLNRFYGERVSTSCMYVTTIRLSKIHPKRREQINCGLFPPKTP